MRRYAMLLMLALTASVYAQPNPGYAEREDVRAFIREMVSRHGFVAAELETLFSRVRRQPAILDAIRPTPPRQRSWAQYRQNFINDRRVSDGVSFWRANESTLAQASSVYGVPAEYIVSIIGIETLYGRNTGKWRVVDALTTLAFDYPPRAEFFRSELEQFLLLARRSDRDVFSVRGSYAGAIGIPQFMPGSYLRYGVDFDGNGMVDLAKSTSDAIGSVANFLREHGWVPGAEVSVPANVSGDGFRAYADGEVLPRHTLDELARAGVSFDTGSARDTRAVLIALETPDAPPEYRVGFRNFYVITRYNRSSFYASAVHDLALALRAARR